MLTYWMIPSHKQLCKYYHPFPDPFSTSPTTLRLIKSMRRTYPSFFHRHLDGSGALTIIFRLSLKRKQNSESHKPMMQSIVCALPLASNPLCFVARSEQQILSRQRQGHGMLFIALMLQHTSMPEIIVWLVKHIYRSGRHILSDQIFPNYMFQTSVSEQPL